MFLLYLLLQLFQSTGGQTWSDRQTSYYFNTYRHRSQFPSSFSSIYLYYVFQHKISKDFLVDSTHCLNCSGNPSLVRSATYSASTVSKYPSCLWYDVWSWSCHLTKPSDSLSLNKIHCWCYPLASWCIISDPLSGCYIQYSLATFHLYNCC